MSIYACPKNPYHRKGWHSWTEKYTTDPQGSFYLHAPLMPQGVLTCDYCGEKVVSKRTWDLKPLGTITLTPYAEPSCEPASVESSASNASSGAGETGSGSH